VWSSGSEYDAAQVWQQSVHRRPPSCWHLLGPVVTVSFTSTESHSHAKWMLHFLSSSNTEENNRNVHVSAWSWILATCVVLVSFTLKLEATCSHETAVDFQQTTRRYIPEDKTVHNHRCENLIPYLFNNVAQFRLLLEEITKNYCVDCCIGYIYQRCQ
jgi:hypothetical protein